MKYLFFLTVATFTTTLVAQNFAVPDDLTLETEADYAAQNENVVAAVNWLRDTHINNETKKRTRVNAYLLQWLTGTPTMTLTLNADLADYGDCGDCLMLYMGGYAKTVIESGNKDDQLTANLGAINTLIAFYEKSKGGIGKVKSIEKFIKLRDKGKLEAAIAKALG